MSTNVWSLLFRVSEQDICLRKSAASSKAVLRTEVWFTWDSVQIPSNYPKVIDLQSLSQESAGRYNIGTCIHAQMCTLTAHQFYRAQDIQFRVGCEHHELNRTELCICNTPTCRLIANHLFESINLSTTSIGDICQEIIIMNSVMISSVMNSIAELLITVDSDCIASLHLRQPSLSFMHPHPASSRTIWSLLVTASL